jgi:hypothetical protein
VATSNPRLIEEERCRLVARLMDARRAVRSAQGQAEQVATTRRAVDEAKRALGERGAVWWTDGAPDRNPRNAGLFKLRSRMLPRMRLENTRRDLRGRH